METERWLVVGLGNPGREYRRHRHNAGFMVVDSIAQREDSFCWRNSNRFAAELAPGDFAHHPIILVKPQTYMNRSGQAVGALTHFYRVPPERLLVVHDEIDLELGRLKVKRGGGDGGHNGLRSITETLGSPEYSRIRLGIGRPRYGDAADYVLHNFDEAERELVDKEIQQATKAIRTLISRGLKEAMNRFNRPAKKDTAKKDTAKKDTTTQEEKTEEEENSPS